MNNQAQLRFRGTTFTAARLACLALLTLLSVSTLLAQSDEALREAARQGDLAAVNAALAAGADIESGDRYNATALFLAARAGHVEIVRHLAERGADVNAAESFYDARPLETALENDDLEMARTLLALGAESREGALAAAVRGEDEALARAVVDAGPINQSTVDRLRAQAQSPGMKAVIEAARTRPDPPIPTLGPDELERFVGSFEGWISETSATAMRRGDTLLLSVNGSEPVELEVVEHGIAGMAETTFRTVPGPGQAGAMEASFWGRYGSVEGIYLTLPETETEMLRRSVAEPIAATDRLRPSATERSKRNTLNWPGFRGQDGDGIGDGAATPVSWNIETGDNVRFAIEIPGLGNSSPVVWGDRIFVTTAIAEGEQEGIRVGNTGSGETVRDEMVHSWQVLAFDKTTGKQLWSTEIGRGRPLTSRHFKATQANSTPVTDGKHLVVVFPTAGIASLDFDGNILWRHELGGLNASAFMDPELEWGYSSSPILYDDTVILQVDISKSEVDEGAYLAAWDVSTGKTVWKVPRDVAPSFSTPSILHGSKGDELVVNGSTIHGYDPATGKELWSLGPNSELVIARPVVGDDLVYVSAGYAPIKPIYAVRAGTRGKIELTRGQEHESLAWSHEVGGAYMPTPLLYEGLFYLVHHNGRLVAYDAKTGDAYYKTRFSEGGTFTASPVVVNGRIYVPTEEGQMYVVAAGVEYQELAINEFNEPLMATPAVSEGTLYVRTPGHLYAIAEK
jgi:outer membrane protein assembly factor BamB